MRKGLKRCLKRSDDNAKDNLLYIVRMRRKTA